MLISQCQVLRLLISTTPGQSHRLILGSIPNRLHLFVHHLTFLSRAALSLSPILNALTPDAIHFYYFLLLPGVLPQRYSRIRRMGICQAIWRTHSHRIGKKTTSLIWPRLNWVIGLR